MIDIPDELARTQIDINGADGRAFIEGLPERAAHFLDLWGLTVTGPSMHGMASLVLPVTRTADGVRAALKMQIRDEESEGEPVGLRIWDGNGIVRLLDDDPGTGTMLLERLDEKRHLSAVADSREAVRILAELLARLVAVQAPEGMRTLGDIAGQMLEDVPTALKSVEDESHRRLLQDCAAAVREVVGEPGDRLLHWDLHFDNVLAADREPWLAIDPKPLAGDPGFDLWPALDNRFEADEVLWRFDLLTETLGLDRERAKAWTLGRLLQNALWCVEDEDDFEDSELEIARRLLGRRG